MTHESWPPFDNWYRPPIPSRTYHNEFLEEVSQEIASTISNPVLRNLFLNCFMNTLDTTINATHDGTNPLTYVITGDIDAMWLRDSTLQMRPYLEFVTHSSQVRELFVGLISRQSDFILIDPYANAFYNTPKFGIHKSDLTEMKPGVHERKWELDSLIFHIDLVCSFARITGDLSIFTPTEINTITRILDTLKIEQRLTNHSLYHFDRVTGNPIDTLSNSGKGPNSGFTGMIHSAFRPSDDACEYPFHIPSNLFAAKVLKDLAEFLLALNLSMLQQLCSNLVLEIESGIEEFGINREEGAPTIYYYEVDGLGNANVMDDANIPNLLSLPYLQVSSTATDIYQATRGVILSSKNPYFYRGTLGSGIGSPHTPENFVWPISLITEAFTTQDREVWRRNLRLLLVSSAHTGLLHESFDIADPSLYTRPWFAWCNSYFGEFILRIWREDPNFLREFE